MKAFLAFTFLFLSCFMSRAQAPQLTFSVASDTSYLLFKGIPKMMVARSGKGTSTKFQMARQDFKAFLETTSFLQSSRELALKNLSTFESLLSKKDSTISILNLKNDAELKRSENFKTSYEELKAVSQNYQAELNACIKDMQTMNDERRKTKRWTFIKGALCGLVVGSIGGILITH